MTLRRVAFWSAALAVPLGILSDVLYVAAEGFRMEPATMVRLDVLAADPSLLRWAASTDFLSFYVPLVPIALYLRRRFDGRDALLDLYTLGAVLFAAVGGAAAIVLGTVGSALAAANAAAGPAAGPEYRIAATALEGAIVIAICRPSTRSRWASSTSASAGTSGPSTGRSARSRCSWVSTRSVSRSPASPASKRSLS